MRTYTIHDSWGSHRMVAKSLNEVRAHLIKEFGNIAWADKIRWFIATGNNVGLGELRYDRKTAWTWVKKKNISSPALKNGPVYLVKKDGSLDKKIIEIPKR